MQIDYLREEDVKTAAILEKEAFSEPWSEQDFLDCMSKPGFALYALKDEAKVIGYLCFTKALDEADVANVCVDPEYRGRGLGYSFFSECLKREEEQGIRSFFLEVRRSNAPAIGLYTKCGFVTVGERKNYYHYPTEDALLMMKTI